jgi:phosphopantetheine--protein transferase-like protein
VGVDLCAVDDVAAAVERFGPRYLHRCFTAHELSACQDDAPAVAAGRLAARFAAKEAVAKLLRPDGAWPSWQEIEVVREDGGWCGIDLHGSSARRADERGCSTSLSASATTTGCGWRWRPRWRRCARAGQGPRRGERQPVDDRIRAVVDEHGRLAVPLDKVADSDDLYRAGLTSHASVSLMLALEDEFDVEFPEDMLNRRTFESIANIRAAMDKLVEQVP